MNKVTLKALRGSIAKWRAIVNGTGRDMGTENCPLCAMFMVEDLDGQIDSCDGCPVFDRTGIMGCGETPYMNFCGEHGYAITKRDKAAAKKELDFLISLLPKRAKKPPEDETK